MRTTMKAVILLLIGVQLYGCSTQRVAYDYDPAIDFVAFKSYRWLTKDHAGNADPRIANDLLNERVRKAIDTTLAQKNYLKLPKGNVDFLVTYQLGIEKKTDVDRIHTGVGFGYRFWHLGIGTDTIVREYNQVTLYIDIIDPKTQKLIWRGSREYRYQNSGTVAEKGARIQEIVAEILAGFPPYKKS